MSTVPLSDLLRLSVAERIQLVESLWGSVAAEATARPDLLPVSEDQRQEVLHRSAAYQQNPSAAAPLEKALERIERALG